MKTLTELSGSLIRTAAAAIAEARRSLPKEAPAPSPVKEPEAQPALAQETAAPEVAAADAPAATEPQAAPAAEPAPAKAAAARREEEESEAVKAALDEAVAKATGLSGDRLSFLRGAVKAAGRRAADVRLVRVFGPEEPVSGAATIEGHQFVVDFLPNNMKQVPVPQKDDRGRRGGGGRGGGGGHGGGKGAAPGGTGGFSMDSLRDDRKNNRGGPGRPGGGRPGGGGGRPPGGGAGRGGPGGNRGR